MITLPLLLVCAILAPATPGSDLALSGYDPVALCEGEEVPGREDLVVTHGRYTYRFVSKESRARFLEEPERWGIQWGGGCGRMGPLSGVGSPDRWIVHAGRIYIFASDGCRDGFRQSPERFVVVSHELPAFSAEDRAAGAAWIAKAVAAHGGAAAIDEPRALRLLFEGPNSSGWTQRLEHVIARDGAFSRRSTWIPPESDEGSETLWVLGDESFVDEGEAVIPLTSPDQLEDLRRYAHREPLALLWARASDGFLAVHRGQGMLGDAKVEEVLVVHAGLTTMLHLDAEDGRVRGFSWRGRPGDGVTRRVEETFTDYADVNGVLVPTRRVVSVDGQEQAALAVPWQEVELLREVPKAAFGRNE